MASSDTAAAGGRYIIIEGPPGAGVSTQIELLAGHLRSEGYPVKIFAESLSPTDKPEISSAIKSARDNGIICIRKRSVLCALINSFYGDGSITDYKYFNDLLTTGFTPNPDMLLILDADTDLLLKNYIKQAPDDDSALNNELLERIRTGFVWEAKQRKYPLIKTGINQQATHEAIWELLSGKPAPKPPKYAPPIYHEATPIKEVLDKNTMLKPHTMFSRNQPENTSKKKAYNSETPKQDSELKILNVSILAQLQLRRAASYDWTNKNMGFYTPGALKGELKTHYKEVMKEIISKRHDITTKLAGYLKDTSVLSIKDRGKNFNKAIEEQANQITSVLLPLSLLQSLEEDEYINLNMASSAFPEIIRLKNNNGSKTNAGKTNNLGSIRKVSISILQNNLGTLDEDLVLIRHWPRNEFELLPAMLYEHTASNLRDLRDAINDITYDKKLEAFNAYMGSYKGQGNDVLRLTNYTWDLLTDCAVLYEFLQHKPQGVMVIQDLTPRYGFDMPKEIEDAGLGEEYEACFDKIASLYSRMQSEGLELEAQYATLMGHRLRWSVSNDILGLAELNDTAAESHSTAYRQLIKAMHEKVASIHPLLTDALVPEG